MDEKIPPTIRLLTIPRLNLGEPVEVGKQSRIGKERGTVIRIYDGLTPGSKLADICLSRVKVDRCNLCTLRESSCEAPLISTADEPKIEL